MTDASTNCEVDIPSAHFGDQVVYSWCPDSPVILLIYLFIHTPSLIFFFKN